MMEINKLSKKLMIVWILFMSIAISNTTVYASIFNKIAFASMRIIDVGIEEWNYNLRDLAKHGYIMKYSSFRKVSEKLQQTQLKPSTAVIHPGNQQLTFKNTKALNTFHNRIEDEFDKYLRVIATANNARLIIFDTMEIHRVKNFINDNQKLLLTIMVYYLDSNSVGIEYIPLTKDLFYDFIRLKTIMHKAISVALEEALVNSGGLTQSSQPMGFDDAPDSSKIENSPNQNQQQSSTDIQYSDAWD